MKTKRRYAWIGAFLICLLSVQGLLVRNAGAAEQRYVGLRVIEASIDVNSNGVAHCAGTLNLKTNYSAKLEITLYQDGIALKSWSTSGSGSVTLSKTYAVTSGHTYSTKAVATVYNASNVIVETVTGTSKDFAY